MLQKQLQRTGAAAAGYTGAPGGMPVRADGGPLQGVWAGVCVCVRRTGEQLHMLASVWVIVCVAYVHIPRMHTCHVYGQVEGLFGSHCWTTEVCVGAAPVCVMLMGRSMDTTAAA